MMLRFEPTGLNKFNEKAPHRTRTAPPVAAVSATCRFARQFTAASTTDFLASCTVSLRQ